MMYLFLATTNKDIILINKLILHLTLQQKQPFPSTWSTMNLLMLFLTHTKLIWLMKFMKILKIIFLHKNYHGTIISMWMRAAAWIIVLRRLLWVELDQLKTVMKTLMHIFLFKNASIEILAKLFRNLILYSYIFLHGNCAIETIVYKKLA